jgi:protease-4
VKRLAAAALALALARPAHAVSATPELPLLLYGNESVATADGARGQLFNPATVGLGYHSELLFSWTREQPTAETNHVLGSAGWFGIHATRVKDVMQAYGFALAGGNSEKLRFGLDQTWLVNDAQHQVTSDQRVGLLSRPQPWLSLGGIVDHLFQPDFQNVRLGRVYTLGLGLRPLAWSRPRAYTLGPRFTLTGDLAIPEDGEWGQARVRVGGELEALPGVWLRGSVEDHGGYHFGIGIAAPRAGFHVQGMSRAGDFTAQTYNVTVHDSEDRTALIPRGDRRVAAIKLGGTLGDESLGGLTLYGPVSTTAVGPVHRQLERALEDPLTRGVLLELDGVSNMAQLEELRPRIARLRRAGKPVVAYLEEGATRGDLYLAAACDRIVATEEASFAALGLRVERRYYRRLLASWGVRVDRSSIGRYKSAFRNFSVDSTPPADREAIERTLDQQQEAFVSAVSEDRRMDRARLETLLDGRAWPPEEVRRAGLIDTLGYREDAVSLLGGLCGLGRKPRVVSLDRVRGAHRAWNVPARVAVVYASGGIENGPSGNDLLLGPTLGSKTLTRQMDCAFRQPGVRAVVLRVESPGGSVVASNLIDHELQRLKRETRKPVVISMGSVAASGGYYISMNGDRIVANRMTRTGSIGVVYYQPSIEGWDRAHQVREDDFERGRAMGLWSGHRDWRAGDQASVDTAIAATYRRFVDKVAAARRLSSAAVDSVAQGRVWLGEDARDRRLIDGIGGLEEAVAEARRLGGIPEGERIRLAEYRRPRPPFLQRLLASAAGEAWAREMAWDAFDTPLYWADDDSEP